MSPPLLEPPSLESVAAWLEARLESAAFGDVPTLWQASPLPVRRLGLALEPADLGEGGSAGRPVPPPGLGLDAVFLHRPFRLAAGAPPGLGVLAAHEAFDAHLTTGFNRPLAEALGLGDLEPFAPDGKLAGMVGDLEVALPWSELEGLAAARFGGLEAVEPGGVTSVSRVAVVNALNRRLVEAAAERGVGAYLTGQMRASGQGPAAELGVGLVAVGHRRSELWGLRRLGRELAAKFGLEAFVLERGRPAQVARGRGRS